VAAGVPNMALCEACKVMRTVVVPGMLCTLLAGLWDALQRPARGLAVEVQRASEGRVAGQHLHLAAAAVSIQRGGAIAVDQIEVKALRVVRLIVCCAAAAAAIQVLRRLADGDPALPQLLQRAAAWAVPLGRRWHLCQAEAGRVVAERAAVAGQRRLGAAVRAAPHARCIRVDAVAVSSSCLVLHHGCWGAVNGPRCAALARGQASTTHGGLLLLLRRLRGVGGYLGALCTSPAVWEVVGGRLKRLMGQQVTALAHTLVTCRPVALDGARRPLGSLQQHAGAC
jgi:hypothetical protein